MNSRNVFDNMRNQPTADASVKTWPTVQLYLLGSCSMAIAGGVDKSKSERRAAADAQDWAASQAATTEPSSCAVTRSACEIDHDRDIAAELSRKV